MADSRRALSVLPAFVSGGKSDIAVVLLVVLLVIVVVVAGVGVVGQVGDAAVEELLLLLFDLLQDLDLLGLESFKFYRRSNKIWSVIQTTSN